MVARKREIDHLPMVDQARMNSDCFSNEINPSLTKTLICLPVGSLQFAPMY